MGGLSGAKFGTIHDSELQGINRVVADGLTGALSGVLNGGKFGHGFASAGLTQWASQEDCFPQVDPTVIWNRTKNAVSSALLGGTVSSLTGGKFGNGAATAMFSRLLNDLNGEEVAPKVHRMAAIKRLYGDILEAGNIDLDANMKLAASMSIVELGEALIDKSVWNYKQNSSLIEALKSAGNYDANLLAEFGNLHAGMVYGAAGVRLDFALTAGGGYQAFSQNIRGDNFSSGAAASSVGGFLAWFTGQTVTTSQTIKWAADGFTWGDNSDDIWPIIQGYCTTNSSCD